MGYKNQRYVMIKIEGIEKAKENERPFLGIYKDHLSKKRGTAAFVLLLQAIRTVVQLRGK